MNTKHDNPMKRLFVFALSAALTFFACAAPSLAQNGRPGAEPPEQTRPAPMPAVDPQAQTPSTGHLITQVEPPVGNGTAPMRKGKTPQGKVTLAFKEVPVDENIVGLVASLTGKVVIPINLQALKVHKITLMHDEPVEGAAALDLVLKALQVNGVGIDEKDDVIFMDDIQNLKTKTPPVFTADMDIMHLTQKGNFIVKIYRLKEASADSVIERIQDNAPDFATVSSDLNSNQIILYADVATAQHFQILINELDHNHIVIKTETFRLAHADATAVSNHIVDLFDSSGTQQSGAGNVPRQPRPQQNRGAPRTPTPGQVNQSPVGASPGPVVELRVSVDVQQNSVTVSAEPAKVDAIAKLIHTEWDLPRPKETFRVYTLEHTDPIKMRDLIQNLMGQGGGSRSQAGRTTGAATRTAQPQVAGGGGSGLSEVIGDIYRVEAYSDRNSIIVISKTKEALDYLDAFVAANDLPSNAGLPQVVELKHANAVSLADELNVLLAEAGTGTGLARPGAGLTAEGPGGFDTTGANSGSSTGGTANRTGTGTGTGGGSTGNIEFPWQRARQRDDQSEPSPLIGKVRLVPIIRQNALAVLAPVAQRYAVVELIKQFDRPGRQVMISAIIAEVQLTNDFAMGLRFSSSAISPTNSDNAITGGVSLTGTTNNFAAKLFDTSVLEANVDINVLLQALSQKTNIRIIQEPRVFTADNEEAAFFDGQQIPFITNSVVNSQVNGGVTQSFEYKNVGVLLNVRPRITVQRDVDMEIKLALSAVVPGQTLFGGAILDLRQTTTKVIVKNAQTIVLSGLLKDLDSKVTRSIPLLGDLPLIGELFKSHDNSKSTNELIAFITPIVVDNPSENDDNFNKREREDLQKLTKPINERSRAVEDERKSLREKVLAPKSPTGDPMPSAIHVEENPYDHRPPTEPRKGANPLPPADRSKPVTPAPTTPDQEPAVPPVDVDDLNGEPVP